MAQYRNAAQFYQKNSVQTASPAKIILMLYDGAIKFCHMAQVAIDEKNIEKANLNIQKAQRSSCSFVCHLIQSIRYHRSLTEYMIIYTGDS